MSREKMDIAKVLAMLAQPKEKPAPLENVLRRMLDVSYITKENTVDTRPVQMVIPKGATKPYPLVFVPHYSMGEDALELRAYLSKGWAVASPADFIDKYNGQLTDNDLVFNNAALYTLRRLPEIDRKRIAVVGGSAGGYMALMLTGLQLGICATIANGPIANAYFNFHYYFNKAQALNLQALAKIQANKETAEKPEEANTDEKKGPLDLLKSVMDLPIPFLAGLAGIFLPLLDNFPDKDDVTKWEALSAVGIADRFSSPIMVNHNTSDILVPVDQITKRYTYVKPGDSLPEDFDIRLPQDFPGKLKYSLEECLPESGTRVERIPVPENDEDSVLPYDPEKLFNINIYDDGVIEGYGTHSSRLDGGRKDDVPYLEEMFERTSVKTNVLTPAMLKSLLVRYQRNCISLPARTGLDDTVYGSLVIYQQEICELLGDWMKNNSEGALNAVFDEVIQTEENTQSVKEFKQTMNEILAEIKQEE